MKVVIKNPDGSVKKVVTRMVAPSRTEQQHRDTVDVRKIIASVKDTRQYKAWLKSPPKSGVYADMTSITDLQGAMEKVLKAQEAFMGLPSDIRSKFANEPGKLIDFLKDPKNNEEAYKLGLKVNPNVPGKIEKKIDELITAVNKPVQKEKKSIKVEADE